MQRAAILSSAASVTPPYLFILSLKRHDFRKKLLNIKCVFLFSLQLLFEIFLTLRRIQRDIVIKSESVFMLSTRYSCRILIKLEFSRQIFQEISNIKFNQNPSGGS